MAIYYFRQHYISAGQGQSAVAAAAYRHSTEMTVDRNRTVADFSAKGDTVHSEIALPADAPDWIRERLGFEAQPAAEARSSEEAHRSLTGMEAVAASEIFWNAVELNEKRVDAQFARETVLALPVELTVEENVALVRSFVAEHITSKGIVADWAFHLPKGGEHNPHVHLMTSLRPLTEDGFGAKTSMRRDPNGEVIVSRGGHVCKAPWAGGKVELEQWRSGWAEHVNVALAMSGHDVRIDHRSLVEQGIQDVTATVHRGPSEHIHRKGQEAELLLQDEIARRATFARFEADPGLVLKHITRQQSTFDYRDIARTIHRYAGEGDDFQALRLRVGALPELVPVRPQIHDPETNRIVQQERFTTLEVLERETTMIETAVARAADTSFRPDAGRAAEALARAEHAQGFLYTPEQRAAIERLTGEGGMAVMVGFAGAGKSTVMRGVAEVYGAEGARVVGAALAGKAADALEHSSGIESRTIASWERSWGNGNEHLSKGDVFVLDEAGMVASAQMARVLQQLDQWGVKIVLVGDGRQLQPIEAGAAFRAIAMRLGYVELTEVRRQQIDWQAEIAVLFGRGETREALGRYAEKGNLAFHVASEGARQAVIDGWSKDWVAGADVAMLAFTNADVQALNAMARDFIKSQGGLQEGERFVTAAGIREFATGDRIIFLENDRSLGVKNGTLGVVEAAEGGQITVAVGGSDRTVIVDQQIYNHVDHGYATTIHKSQGSTIDRIHALATRFMDAQLAYVALTRHRIEVAMHLAMDTFMRRGAKELPSQDEILERLATDKLKDTSADYAHFPDHALALEVLAETKARDASLEGRLDNFLQARGLPHPREVLEQVSAFVQRTRELVGIGPVTEASIRVPERLIAPKLAPVADEVLRHALNRLDHVQRHSEAMGHEGHARRSAFHAAENELTRTSTAPRLRAYADKVADLVTPSTVVAIGRELTEEKIERHLAHHPAATLTSLRDTWKDVHAVSWAVSELRLIETVRDVDGAYRVERQADRIEEEYEAGLSDLRETMTGPVAPSSADRATFISAVTEWPDSVEKKVTDLLEHDLELTAFDRYGRQQAARVWKDPDAAWSQIREEIQSRRDEGVQVAAQIRTEPESFGELLGGRTLLMQPNAERKAALSQVPMMASNATDYGTQLALSSQAHRTAEIDWRSRMTEPLPELSANALQLVETLEAAHAMRQRGEREPAHERAVAALEDRAAWNEVKEWRGQIQERLHGRSIDDIPGLDPESRATMQRAIDRVDRAFSTGDVAITIEDRRAREIAYERDRGQDHEIGY